MPTHTFQIVSHNLAKDAYTLSSWKNSFIYYGLSEAPTTDATTVPVVTLVVSSPVRRSTLTKNSSLVKKWKQLLNSDLSLVFVVDLPDTVVPSSQNKGVELAWARLKDAAREHYTDAAEAISSITAIHLDIPTALHDKAKKLKACRNTKNSSELIRLMKRAAEKGIPEAAFAAAVIFHKGSNGVPQDLVQAAHYYKLSTDIPTHHSGRDQANQVLAQFYARGMGVEQDIEKSLQYLNRIRLSNVLNRRDSYPPTTRLCLSNQQDHSPIHNLYISCSRDFDNEWAQVLQRSFSTWANLSAYVVDECGTGRCRENVISYPVRDFMEKLFSESENEERARINIVEGNDDVGDDDVGEEEKGEYEGWDEGDYEEDGENFELGEENEEYYEGDYEGEADENGEEEYEEEELQEKEGKEEGGVQPAMEIPHSHHFPLDSLHPDDISAISGASRGIIVIVTPFAVKLMQLRLTAGLSDPLFLEWQEIIRSVRKKPTQKLVVLKLASYCGRHPCITEFPGAGMKEQQHPSITRILKELDEISGGACISLQVPFSDGYRAMDSVGKDIVLNISTLYLGKKNCICTAAKHYYWHTNHLKDHEPKVPHSLPTVLSWFPKLISNVNSLIEERCPEGVMVDTFGQDEGGSLDKNDMKLVSTKRDLCFQYADLISKFPEEFASWSANSTAVTVDSMKPTTTASATAQKYFEISARLHHPKAQARFAQCIEQTDPTLSLSVYKKAADNGVIEAIFRLGELWESGSPVIGGEASIDVALEFYQQGEELGHKDSAIRVIGCMKKKMGSADGSGKRDVMALYRLEDGYTFPEVVKRIRAGNPDVRRRHDDSIEEEEAEEEKKDEQVETNSAATEEGIKQLRLVFKQLKQVFCVSGVVPVSTQSPVSIFYEQDAAKAMSSAPNSAQIKKIVFPLSDPAQVDDLIGSCSPASFGLDTETVLDENYRKALKLDGTYCYSDSDQEEDCYSGSVKPTPDIHAELHKLNVYGQEGFFKAHVDTPISADMFGSLVVCLPVVFEGGVLTIARGEADENTHREASSKAFDWGTSTQDATGTHLIQWAAFFSDCPHEISPISSGTRITLTYNLFKRNRAEKVFLDAAITSPRDCAFLSELKSNLSKQSFFECGAVLMFHCQHAYQVYQRGKRDGQRAYGSFKSNKEIDSEDVIPLLKGADMSVFEAALACNLQVFLKPLYDGAQQHTHVLGTQFRGFGESPDEEFGEGWNFLQKVVGNVIEVDDKKVVWFGHALKMDRHEYLHYGNQATVAYVYSSAVIVVVVPPWKDRC
ncbi:UNVERIFIED_CONTAM: hypothetical protein HDU68_007733 [Siphonaria sp. JEL0065]|nr:hypothetical protein HDU68_007733 [Siphonaria sp. JEL0065]